MKSVISFYTPMLIEEQLRLKENFSGNYLMDFRVSSNTSEAMIKAMSSFIYESVPMTRISDNYSARGVSILDNNVLAKSIPLEAKSITYGDKDWAKETNQGIYSDLLIECNFDVPLGQKLEVYWSVTSAVYVIVDSTRKIIGYSPLLASMMTKWKEVNNGVNPSNKDFYGSSSGVTGIYPKLEDTGSGAAKLSKGTGSSTAKINFETGYVENFSPLDPMKSLVGDQFKVFLVGPPSVKRADQILGMLVDVIPLDIYKQGGSTTSTSVTESQTALTITQRDAYGPLKGRATAGNFITAIFPGPISRTTIADTYGVWSIDYPETPLTVDQQGTIQVTQTADSGGGFTSNTETQATVQTSYGLPVLKQADRDLPGGMYGRISNLIEKGSPPYSYLNEGVSGYHSFTKSAPRYILSGLYVGRLLDDYLYLKDRDTFLSNPGSVITEIGMEVSYSAWLNASTSTLVPTEQTIYSNEILIASARLPTFNANKQFYSISYESESLSNRQVRYRMSYERSFENTIDTYKVGWDVFTELVDVTQKWRLSWDSTLPYQNTTEYFFRFEVKLPEEVIYKRFFNINWDRDLSDIYSQPFKIAYEVDQFKPKSYTWKFNWETVLIDQAVVKPYYVKRFLNNKFVDCISFQVYIDYAYAETFMATNRMFFYFSNPPKYELIQFDYNMRPYEATFMEDLKDPNMNNRDDVPDRFVFLGNYTIQDVDINNSFSLDIFAEQNQMNEQRSYWVPENLEDYASTMITLQDGLSKALPIDYKFRDDHHSDIVELDLVILTGAECCFTQKSVGTRCSPY